MLNIFIFYYLLIKIYVISHGYMEYPIQRSSLWRIDKTSPINYDDNGLNCGWKRLYNQTQCGMCGDNINEKPPRKNEIGGKFYNNKLVMVYSNMIDIKIKITANHKGYFNFYLCNLDINIIETPDCFIKINEEKFNVLSNINYYEFSIPVNMKCDHCVLQWVWITGNNGNSKFNEIFINCADIAIV